MSVIPLNSERDALIKASQGSQKAFQELFLKYHNQIGNHVFRITDSKELAEEIVQDVFLKIWMSREALARVHSFKAYLFIISKNHTLNCLRKLAKERQRKQEFEDYAIKTVTTGEEVNIYHSILDEAIDRLPPQQQLVFLLSRHERLKYTEVANRMNISRESVKKYLQIATASVTAYVHTNSQCALTIFLLSTFF
jgi:RNA polymerase sigma-70 factor (family 1)